MRHSAFFAPTDPNVTIPFSINDIFWRNEVTLTTSYAGSPADHETAMELIHAKRVNVKDMITHRFGLAEIVKGFQHVAEAKESIKVIIEPQSKNSPPLSALTTIREYNKIQPFYNKTELWKEIQDEVFIDTANVKEIKGGKCAWISRWSYNKSFVGCKGRKGL